MVVAFKPRPQFERATLELHDERPRITAPFSTELGGLFGAEPLYYYRC